MDENTIPKLRELALYAEQYREERGMSQRQLLKRFSHLGSEKTLSRILDPKDDLENMDVERMLEKYEAARLNIDDARAQDKLAEPEYEKFTNVTLVRGAVLRAFREETIARLVVVEGENGTGKDTSIRFLLNSKIYRDVTYVAEMNPCCGESLAVPLQLLLKAIPTREGKDYKAPRYPAEMLEALITRLEPRRVLLVINEAHHIGLRGLNAIKTLINATQVVPVLFCHPALMRKLEFAHHDEASQLFGNRLCERVLLPSPPANEVIDMMKFRGIKFANTDAEGYAGGQVASLAKDFGNWRFAVDVTRELFRLEKTVTKDDITSVVTKVKNRRIRKKNGEGEVVQ
jgi:hypothetical protein